MARLREELGDFACEPGESGFAGDLVVFVQPADRAVAAMDGDGAGQRVDDPDQLETVGEVVFQLFVHVVGEVGGGENFDGEVGGDGHHSGIGIVKRLEAIIAQHGGIGLAKSRRFFREAPVGKAGPTNSRVLGLIHMVLKKSDDARFNAGRIKAHGLLHYLAVDELDARFFFQTAEVVKGEVVLLEGHRYLILLAVQRKVLAIHPIYSRKLFLKDIGDGLGDHAVATDSEILQINAGDSDHEAAVLRIDFDLADRTFGPSLCPE